MWAQVAQIRLKKLFAEVSKATPPPDPASLEKHYNDGDMLAARHILFSARKNVVKPAEREAARKQAEAVAKQVNAGNFAAMAKKYSADPGSKDSGGELGVFPKGQMVPEFQAGILALKPGEISGPVESDFGYHIIMRLTWADAKDKFTKAYTQMAQQSAESTYGANLEKTAKIDLKPAAAKTIRAIAADLDAYRDDRTEIASAKNVDMTASKVAKWMAAYPPQAQIREKLQQLPDSIMGLFAKQLIVNELMLKAADSAKIQLDSGEKANVRQVFTSAVMNCVHRPRHHAGRAGRQRQERGGAREDRRRAHRAVHGRAARQQVAVRRRGGTGLACPSREVRVARDGQWNRSRGGRGPEGGRQGRLGHGEEHAEVGGSGARCRRRHARSGASRSRSGLARRRPRSRREV